MRGLELACVVIVAMYVALRLFRARDTRAVAARLLLLACAGWAGEDSVIRAYGFYAYDASWSFFLDRVPLLIVVIWPIVIDSAGELAKALAPGHAGLCAGAIILADAALIEPIAVHAGLWQWTAPGAFDVPPIGVLGWAFFGGAAIAWLERAARGFWPALVVLVAPLAAHALLVATWWAVLRWVSGPIPPWAAVALAWLALLPVSLRALRGPPVRVSLLIARAPGAAFFFVLLALRGRGAPELCAYALAFAPPYVAALVRSARLTVATSARSA
jgi:hypothetical protein